MSEHKFKPTTMWALTNCGHVISVHQLRRAAIKEAEYLSGESWRVASQYYDVTKVNVFAVDGGPRLDDWKEARG